LEANGVVCFVLFLYHKNYFICLLFLFTVQLKNGIWNDAAGIQFFSKNQQNAIWVDIAKQAYSFCKDRVIRG
jgi:hypothetical protein